MKLIASLAAIGAVSAATNCLTADNISDLMDGEKGIVDYDRNYFMTFQGRGRGDQALMMMMSSSKTNWRNTFTFEKATGPGSVDSDGQPYFRIRTVPTLK